MAGGCVPNKAGKKHIVDASKLSTCTWYNSSSGILPGLACLACLNHKPTPIHHLLFHGALGTQVKPRPVPALPKLKHLGGFLTWGVPRNILSTWMILGVHTSIFKEPHQMRWPRLWDTPASCWLGMLKHYYEPKPLKPLSVRIKSRWIFDSPDESLKLACRPATGFAAGFENGLYHPFTVIWGMVYIFLFNPHCPKPGVQHHVPTFNSTPGEANCREFFWAPIAAVDEGRATTNQKQYQK